jgi:glutamate N-acetyltransferase / amino-acid N-acetyltransferase
VTDLPRGFGALVANVGVKDASDDLVVVTAAAPIPAAGVFTRSRFASPSVTTSRRHLADRRAQAIVVVAKNANVANGPDGDADNACIVEAIADKLGCRPGDVLIASTGVIGRRYPIARMRAAIGALEDRPTDRTIERAARGIMTTDTRPKVAEATIAGTAARVVGMAKGAGMIEPDMATMIAVVLTDAGIDGPSLDDAFRAVVDRTFNCLSIDTDTSTSDTAVVFASGEAGPVPLEAFAVALEDVALSLTKQIAADGEGAETLIEVRVDGGRDDAQARRVAKAIVNSPLVKTAVHGADPNWGRVAMAIGKCSGVEDADIDPGRVVIRFGRQEVYPSRIDDAGLAALSGYLESEHVLIHVTLHTGDAVATVWGCDLTAGYVRINADYTT